MQIGAKNRALHAALRCAVRLCAKGDSLHSGSPRMDLVPGQRCSRKRGCRRGSDLCAVFFGSKNRVGGQQCQTAQGLRLSAFAAQGVIQRASQHLVAAADAQNRRAALCQLLHRRFQPALPQPQKIRHRVFGAGQNDKVGAAQLPHILHIAHAQQRVLFQRHKIGKIGNMRQAHHCRIQRLDRFIALQPLGQRVLVLDIRAGVGYDSQHRQVGLFFQHGKAGSQNFHVPAKFIDDQSADARTLVRFQQRHCAVQLGKHAAAVNVPHQQHRGVHQLGKPHIDDIVRF